MWDKTHQTVRLDKMRGNTRASRVNIRKFADIAFPDRPTFPLKTKLSGTQGDVNLPVRAVSDSTEDWELQNCGEEADEEQPDGMLGESRLMLIDSVVEGVILDPEEPSEEHDHELFHEDEHQWLLQDGLEKDWDTPDGALHQEVQADEESVGVPTGQKIPTGWRVDVFPRKVGMTRQVSVPP